MRIFHFYVRISLCKPDVLASNIRSALSSVQAYIRAYASNQTLHKARHSLIHATNHTLYALHTIRASSS